MKEYYEGRPCSSCGGVLRYKSNSSCISCYGGDGSRLAATVARETARIRGEKTWTRYKPCKVCGTHERYVINSACVACSKRKSAERYEARPKVRVPSPRDVAIATHQVRYLSRKPCRRCGTHERYTSGGGCCNCMLVASAQRENIARARYNNPQGDRVLWIPVSAGEEYAPLYDMASLSGWHCVFSSQNGKYVGKDVLSRPGAFMAMPDMSDYERDAVRRIGTSALTAAMRIYNMRGVRHGS